MAKVLNSLFWRIAEGFGDRASIVPGQEGWGVTWKGAPSSLAETVHDRLGPKGGLDSSHTSPRQRGLLSGTPGLFDVRDGRVCSTPRTGPKHAEDPNARLVVAMSRWGRTIRFGRPVSGFSILCRVFSGGRPEQGLLRKGKAALLGAYINDCDNYFHLWADTVGDLWFLRRMGIEPLALDRLLMGFSGN